jgi:membrane protein implicated in regulation of membrane protease activity
MPLDRLVLIIVCVLCAAAATVYVGVALLASTQMPPMMGLAMLSIIALCAYVGWRVISERLRNKDDDHYDRFEN